MIDRTNKFVDRARLLIQIQETIQFIKFYTRTYETSPKRSKGIMDKKIDKAIVFIQRYTKFRKRDLVIVDKLLDDGLSLDSDCDETIANRRDVLVVYRNKRREKRYMTYLKKAENNHKQNKILLNVSINDDKDLGNDDPDLFIDQT